MFVLTGLLLTQLPRLFVWLSGTVVPAASLRRAPAATVRTAQTQPHPLAPVHAPTPRLIV
jgi:hypothetical protein